jgi:hypothetical protein
MKSGDKLNGEQKYTLGDLTDLFAQNLGNTIEANGVAVVVCALTTNKFEASVIWNPKYGTSEQVVKGLAQEIGDAVLAILKKVGEKDSPLILPFASEKLD